MAGGGHVDVHDDKADQQIGEQRMNNRYGFDPVGVHAERDKLVEVEIGKPEDDLERQPYKGQHQVGNALQRIQPGYFIFLERVRFVLEYSDHVVVDLHKNFFKNVPFGKVLAKVSRGDVPEKSKHDKRYQPPGQRVVHMKRRLIPHQPE